MKQEPAAAYHVYLLRFWMMDNDGCPQWRLSLEGVHGDAPIYFDHLSDLALFLLTEMERGPPPQTVERDNRPRKV